MRIIVIPKGRPYGGLRLGVGPMYVARDGGPCLRGKTSWRQFSGLWVNTTRGCFWLYFRRGWKS